MVAILPADAPIPAVTHPCTPQTLFDLKWPNVAKVCRYRAAKYRLRSDAREEVLQNAALVLWQQCLAHPDGARTVNARMIALAAWFRYTQQRRPRSLQPGRRIKTFSQIDAQGKPDSLRNREDAFDVAAPETTFIVDGVKLTPADVHMDYARDLQAMENAIPLPELARRMGVTRAYVHLLRYELGGVQLPGNGKRGRWVFPGAAGESVGCR